MKRRRLNGKKRHKKQQHKLDHNEPDRRQQKKQTEEAGAIHAHPSSLKSGSKVINHNQFAAKQPSQSRYKLIRAFAARLQFWLQNELQRHCQDCEDTFFFKAASSRLLPAFCATDTCICIRPLRFISVRQQGKEEIRRAAPYVKGIQGIHEQRWSISFDASQPSCQTIL